MSGMIKKRFIRFIGLIVIAAALSAAIFGILYYSGLLLPKWARWHDVSININDGICVADGKEYKLPPEEDKDKNAPDRIELRHRKVKAYKDGKCIFESPKGCLVQNILYADIDRDSDKEMILLNFNIGRYGQHRPFWVDRDEQRWFQHIYIYDYISEENKFRPIWMASDIGMEASDCSLKDGTDQVIEMEDRYGNRSRWMWISFGLRCVD